MSTIEIAVAVVSFLIGALAGVGICILVCIADDDYHKRR